MIFKVRHWNWTWIAHSKRNYWSTRRYLGWKQYWWKSATFSITFTLL